jgi:hypothetical protein
LTEKISLVYFASGILAIISVKIQLTFSKANFQPVLRALTKKKLAKFDRTVERKVENRKSFSIRETNLIVFCRTFCHQKLSSITVFEAS